MAGISEGGEFVVKKHSEKEWVDGKFVGSEHNGVGYGKFVSHIDIENLAILKSGSLELLTRMTVN